MLAVPSAGARWRVCQRHAFVVGVGRGSHDAVERATLRQGAQRCTTVFERARCRALRNHMSSLPPRFSHGARGARSCVAIASVTQTNATKRLRRCHVSNSGKLVLVAIQDRRPPGTTSIVLCRKLPSCGKLWLQCCFRICAGRRKLAAFAISVGELGAMSTPPPRP